MKQTHTVKLYNDHGYNENTAIINKIVATFWLKMTGLLLNSSQLLFNSFTAIMTILSKIDFGFQPDYYSWSFKKI